MRYRRLGYRYRMVVMAGQAPPLEDLWRIAGVRAIPAQPRWRPETDVYETGRAIVIVVELAGVEEDELEVLLYEDALVVEGRRHLPGCEEGGLYHAVGIRQGPFRVEIPLPAAIDLEGIEARYERGLLRIRLPKVKGGEAHGR
jgi:HSP20 family molecular chaperone IbpA